MANFEHALPTVIEREGGYVLTNWSNDPGGITYAGISRRANPHWDGWPHVEALGLRHREHGRSPAVDRHVADLYRSEYWNRCGCGNINEQEIAEWLFDFAVNHGTNTAIRVAQGIVGVTVDGISGPTTQAAINAYDPQRFLLRIFHARAARYTKLEQRNRHGNLLGWMRRIVEMTEDS